MDKLAGVSAIHLLGYLQDFFWPKSSLSKLQSSTQRLVNVVREELGLEKMKRNTSTTLNENNDCNCEILAPQDPVNVPIDAHSVALKVTVIQPPEPTADQVVVLDHFDINAADGPDIYYLEISASDITTMP